MDSPSGEKINTLLKFHEARLEDIKREERTTEGYIIGEESNRNKTIDQIIALFEPLIEEAKKQERERTIEFIDWLDNGTRSCSAWREEVRKFRQALKEEE